MSFKPNIDFDIKKFSIMVTKMNFLLIDRDWISTFLSLYSEFDRIKLFDFDENLFFNAINSKILTGHLGKDFEYFSERILLIIGVRYSTILQKSQILLLEYQKVLPLRLVSHLNDILHCSPSKGLLNITSLELFFKLNLIQIKNSKIILTESGENQLDAFFQIILFILDKEHNIKNSLLVLHEFQYVLPDIEPKIVKVFDFIIKLFMTLDFILQEKNEIIVKINPHLTIEKIGEKTPNFNRFFIYFG